MSSIENSAKLKNLTTQLKKLEQERLHLDNEISSLGQQRNDLNRRLRKISDEIEKLKSNRSSKVVLSEHAILRFLERVKGFNLKELNSQILPDSSNSAIETLGSGRFPVGNPPTHFLVIRDRVVVTVETP